MQKKIEPNKALIVLFCLLVFCIIEQVYELSYVDVASRPSTVAYENLIFAVYKPYVSPVFAKISLCRLSPTCSEYSAQAVKKYGIYKGGWLTIKRLGSCNSATPMGTGDKVPENIKKHIHLAQITCCGRCTIYSQL
ncbi:MAG: membrane protein insertion efficiency factor YidD [Bacillota bacterium]